MVWRQKVKAAVDRNVRAGLNLTARGLMAGVVDPQEAAGTGYRLSLLTTAALPVR